MKGYRFYKEYDSPQDKRKDKPNGNVFATDEYQSPFRSEWGWNISGYGSVYPEPDSPCVYTSASMDWLRTCCKRISEHEAREIHPNLFKRIED